MFEQAKIILTGQFTTERLWGVVLLALSLATALPAGAYVLSLNSGLIQYAAAALAFVFVFLLGGFVWGKVLSQIRTRWFA